MAVKVGHSQCLNRADRAPSKHLEEMSERIVFETEAQQTAAVKASHVDWDDSVALEWDYARICRPSCMKNKKKPVPFIFWTKDKPEDKPSWNKVVSYVQSIVHLHISYHACISLAV